MTAVRALGVALCLAVAASACATRGGGAPRPRPFPGAALPPGQSDTQPVPEQAAGHGDDAEADEHSIDPEGASEVVRTALELLGVPYRYGGSDPSGFDCSGLVQWVYARHGTDLPREVRDQYRVGRKIDLEDLRPGDLIFFETVARGASHVGVVIGHGQFVHAPSSNGVVRVEPYNANYWIRRFVGARRVGETVNAAAMPVPFPGSTGTTK